MLKNVGIIADHSSDSATSQKKGFKQIEDYLLKKRTISEMTTSMVVDGTLTDRDDDGIHIRIHTVYHLDKSTNKTCIDKKFECIDPCLDIGAQCLFSEIATGDSIDSKRRYTKQFPIGSQVKGVIIKVDYHTLEIYITTLPSHSPHPYHKLGLSNIKSPNHSHKGTHQSTHQSAHHKLNVHALTPTAFSPYYKRYSTAISAPTSPSMMAAGRNSVNTVFTPTYMARTKSCDDQKSNTNTVNPYYSNHYYAPSSTVSNFAPSPLYTAVENVKYATNQNMQIQNEFDLLQRHDDDEESHSNEMSTGYGHRYGNGNGNGRKSGPQRHRHGVSSRKLWVDRIRKHELFRNPAGMDMMRDAFGIEDYSSMMVRKPNVCTDILGQDMAEELFRRPSNDTKRLKKNGIDRDGRDHDDSKHDIMRIEERRPSRDSRHRGTDSLQRSTSISSTSSTSTSRSTSISPARLSIPKLVEFDKDYLRREQAFFSSRSALKSGVQHATAGRLDKAVEHYQVALEWDREYGEAMVALGAANAKQGRLDKAEQWIRDAIRIDPDTPNATKYLAIVLEKKACDDPPK